MTDADEFLHHLYLAALFHDIGKANAHFYEAVLKQRKQQALRHETISTLILHLPQIRDWLKASPLPLDLEIITAAVLSHHLKAHPEDWSTAKGLKPGDEIELYLNASDFTGLHPEVNNILQQVAAIAEIPEFTGELPDKWIADSGFWLGIMRAAEESGKALTRSLKPPRFKSKTDNSERQPKRSLLLAVKAGLIAADSVASGVFRTKSSEAIVEWVDKYLHRPKVTAQEIEDEILQKRYQQIREKFGKFELKEFQKKAEFLANRALLLSGCGTGKTIFAYKWLQKMVETYDVGHIIFLYPTRGTATEGFKDYVAWAPETDASLLTGTATYELQAMAENPEEGSNSVKDKDFTTDARLFALGYWGKRFFSATVDQFLSFLTHSYGSICLLPVLADSAIVIDEIHSFSPRMFGHLQNLLKNFDIPVLCLTATLPKVRRDTLLEAKHGLQLEVFSAEDDAELEQIEQRNRYVIQSIADQAEAESIVKQAYADENCVLWVVNNVDRCRQISNTLTQAGIEVLTYHSRFKLIDRKDRHRETVDRFAFSKTEKQKPVVAVTTQVCEMSLDLDADVLITELAPISSLVQRFGRSNRSSERPADFRSQIYVYAPPEGKIKPYQDFELDLKKGENSKVQQFIQKVSGEVSPYELAEALLEYSPDESQVREESSFITSGYWATTQSFRGNEEEFTTNAILWRDLDLLKTRINAKEPFDDLILPVLKSRKFLYPDEDRPSWMPKYIALARDEFYCPKRGYGT
ncbi:CRISPR-associated helicase Cas3' [Alkalinema pantanalense CENA528]|uniref:CRISPR-associated helicase Cas3' n=1 Tax=Alkalinema pantanalense TaxID=1620705 RepID=UPI003D6FA9ED